jgi:hypothetical protein
MSKFADWKLGDYAQIEFRDGVWLVKYVIAEKPGAFPVPAHVILVGWDGEQETIYTPASLTHCDGPVTRLVPLPTLKATGPATHIRLNDVSGTILPLDRIETVAKPTEEEVYWHIRHTTNGPTQPTEGLHFVWRYDSETEAMEDYERLTRALCGGEACEP